MSRTRVRCFLGLEIGKEEHCVGGLTPDAKTVQDRVFPQPEAKIGAVLAALATHLTVPVVVHQRASSGALAVTIAWDAGIDMPYPPGLAMRGIGDLHPGNA